MQYLAIYILASCNIQLRRSQCGNNWLVMHIIFGLTILQISGFLCKEDYYDDDNEMNFQELFDFFTDENCPSLKGKPKLIFIQVESQ